MTNFVWQTRHGEHLQPADMPTRYVFNCLRMIFNATAPDRLRLPGKVRSLRWSARYRRAACIALLRALRGRELTVRQAQAMATMREAAAQTFPSYQALLP